MMFETIQSKMFAMPGTGRRTFLHVLWSACFGLARARAADEINPSTAHLTHVRRYRADAIIMLLSMPVFSRVGVGGAYVVIEESARSSALQFAAGSLPSRARGLNRMGFFEESIKHEGGPLETSYFGFMTSSKEATFAQAKKAMEARGAMSPFAAAQGSAAGGQLTFRVCELQLPSNLSFAETPALILGVREQVSASKGVVREGVLSSTDCGTFLYTIRQAMRSGKTSTKSRFLHNGKPFDLATKHVPDPSALEQFLAKGLVPADSKVIRIEGEIKGEDGSTPFRLWFKEGEGLPIRFEFRPKSFLKLAFEIDAGTSGPTFNLKMRTAV